MEHATLLLLESNAQKRLVCHLILRKNLYYSDESLFVVYYFSSLLSQSFLDII